MEAGTRKKPIIYVSREIERTLGTVPGPDYYIVAGETPYAKSIQAKYPDYVTLIPGPSGDLLGTSELLEHPTSKKLISRIGGSVVVFKNTLRIEPIIQDAGWNFINPPAALAEKIENKISQIAWLGDLAGKFLPPHKVLPAKEIVWDDSPTIVQWAHGHTGDGTFVVNSESDLKTIQAKFPARMARVTQKVNGPSFTVNVVVTPTEILAGNLSYQITGLAPFTENPFSTVGNDWSLPGSLLSPAETERIAEIISEIAKRMQAAGWRGLFGIDLIRDDERNIIYLIEINARQPASSTFESELQRDNRRAGIPGITTFEAHLAALSGEKLTTPLIVINDGAQIVQRLTGKVKEIDVEAARLLSDNGYQVVTYTNTAVNSDLMRIQSTRGIMETHNKLNERGKSISEILTGPRS